MFLSLPSGQMFQSPARSRTHSICFCSWMCILETRNILVTVFFPLPPVSYFSESKYGMYFSSIHYGDSHEATNVTHAAVPELVGAHPAGMVVLTGEQQHRPAQPGSSTGALLLLATLPPLCHSHTPALLRSHTAPRCSPQSQGLSQHVLRSCSPSVPDRGSRTTARPPVCSQHQPWLKPALVAVLDLFGSDVPPLSALPPEGR